MWRTLQLQARLTILKLAVSILFFSLEESDPSRVQGSGMSGKEKKKVRTCERVDVNGYYIETRDQVT